jgi:hypothetical protein
MPRENNHGGVALVQRLVRRRFAAQISQARGHNPSLAGHKGASAFYFDLSACQLCGIG